MERLPSLTTRQVIAVLKKIGFTEHHQRGSHRYFRHPERRLRVPVAMHHGDIPRGTLRAIIRQIGLTEDEFRALL